MLLMQCEVLELQLDTNHIFNLIKIDKKYANLLRNLPYREGMIAVTHALNLLYSAPPPGEEWGQRDLTPDGCMVVSILEQFFIRLFTKRLMNLMSAEAVILNRNKIPCTYLENYLSFQAHFSLKMAIENCLVALTR